MKKQLLLGLLLAATSFQAKGTEKNINIPIIAHEAFSQMAVNFNNATQFIANHPYSFSALTVAALFIAACYEKRRFGNPQQYEQLNDEGLGEETFDFHIAPEQQHLVVNNLE